MPWSAVRFSSSTTTVRGTCVPSWRLAGQLRRLRNSNRGQSKAARPIPGLSVPRRLPSQRRRELPYTADHVITASPLYLCRIVDVPRVLPRAPTRRVVDDHRYAVQRQHRRRGRRAHRVARCRHRGGQRRWCTTPPLRGRSAIVTVTAARGRTATRVLRLARRKHDEIVVSPALLDGLVARVDSGAALLAISAARLVAAENLPGQNGAHGRIIIRGRGFGRASVGERQAFI